MKGWMEMGEERSMDLAGFDIPQTWEATALRGESSKPQITPV